MTELPTISVLIPTLNSERYLDSCLQSIKDQDYPSELIEIIAADGGSTDSTLAILQRHGVERVEANPLVTGEAARAILNTIAGGELILSVDSDNHLVGRDWLRRVAQPLLDDPSVFASEPLRWEYSAKDPPLNRYFALTGVNDPLSLFMGNYGRYSYLTGRWTELEHREERHSSYLVAELIPGQVPTMGANGFLVRSHVLKQLAVSGYYFDIDAVNDLVSQGHRRIAKVDVELGHQFARNLIVLRRKIRRRIDDFFFWQDQRHYPWLSAHRFGTLKFVLYTVLVLPLVVQSIRGWFKVRDIAWLYHVPVCWLTLGIYGSRFLQSFGRRAPYSREGWRQ